MAIKNSGDKKIDWEVIKHILFDTPQEKLSRSLEERVAVRKIESVIFGAIMLISLFIFLSTENVFGNFSSLWDVFEIITIAVIFLIALDFFEIALKKKILIFIELVLSILVAFCFVYLIIFYNNVFPSKLIRGLEGSLLGMLFYYIKSIPKLLEKLLKKEKNKQSVDEEIKKEVINTNNQLSLKKDWWGNKNLGFKGFLLAILYFIIIMLFIMFI